MEPTNPVFIARDDWRRLGSRPQQRPRRRWLRRLISLVLLAAVGLFGVYPVVVVYGLSHPAHKALAALDPSLNLHPEDVSFPSQHLGVTLRGWWLAAPGASRSVILAHGYAGNRLEGGKWPKVAAALLGAGYNVLMFDFEASGQSDGKMVTLGNYEHQDLSGAVDFVRSRSPGKVGVLGVSMGASTAIITAAADPRIEAVIADAPFADRDTYLEQNLPHWSHLPALWTPVLEFWGRRFTGLEYGNASALAAVPKLGNHPLLLIHGDTDAAIPLAESEALDRAANPATTRLEVFHAGPAHAASFKSDPARYLVLVLEFFNKNLT